VGPSGPIPRTDFEFHAVDVQDSIPPTDLFQSTHPMEANRLRCSRMCTRHFQWAEREVEQNFAEETKREGHLSRLSAAAMARGSDALLSRQIPPFPEVLTPDTRGNICRPSDPRCSWSRPTCRLATSISSCDRNFVSIFTLSRLSYWSAAGGSRHNFLRDVHCQRRTKVAQG